MALDRPLGSAIFALNQWVTFFGVDSNVPTTTSLIGSAVIVGGHPGQGSSTRAPKRSNRKRARHLLTVFVEHPACSATHLLSKPSPHRSTVRDRNANACEDFGRRKRGWLDTTAESADAMSIGKLQREPKAAQANSGGQVRMTQAERFCFPSSQSVSDASLCAVPVPTCLVSIFSPFLMTCTSAIA